MIGSYSGCLLSSKVHVEGGGGGGGGGGLVLVDWRSGWVMGEYLGGLLSSTVLEGRPR